jgi:hypothetical protein
MRANVDAFTKMTNRSFENYAAFCECFRPNIGEPTAKSGAKAGKGAE